MSLPDALLLIEKNIDRCLLCDKKLLNTEKVQTCSSRGWQSLKDLAEKWSDVNFSNNDPYQNFNAVYSQIAHVEHCFGKVHVNCRTVLGTQRERYLKRYGKIKIEDSSIEDVSSHVDETSCRKSQRSSSDSKSKRRICFICFDVRGCDNDSSKKGGLARCEMSQSQERLVNRSAIYSNATEHRFHDAAKRFEVLRGGQSFDNFAIDIYYHTSCYVKYAINPVITEINENNQAVEDVMNDFYRLIRVKIIKNKEAYLLNQLHSYLQVLCKEYGIEQIYTHTAGLKRDLLKQFEDKIDFFPTGKYVIVYSSNMNPCEYSIATLKGKGLRGQDYVRSFGKFIRMRVNETTFEKPPESPEEMIKAFDTGPLPELYNVIYATLYTEDFKTNEKGYAITNSKNISTKIWSLASDWQSLITRQESSKQAMLGLTIHRLTGSKEAVMNVNKFGHSISYNRVCEYNDRWSKSVSQVHKRFITGIPLHSSIDNNDGRQETSTGSGTTHDTNMTLFQPLLPGEFALKNPALSNDFEVTNEDELPHEIPEYAIPLSRRSEPPKFEPFEDDDHTDLLQMSMRKDLVWSIANGLPNHENESLPLLGSWTAFQRKISDSEQEKSLIEYMPIIGQPPRYDVCKYYLDNLNEIMNDLGLSHMFSHADEEVYARLAHVIWKYGDLYKRVIIVMGGFHQLRVKQRTIFKRHGVVGYKDWFVDAGIIAPGSVDRAFGGFHYYRGMRILKESFDAMVQYRVEQLTDSYKNMDLTLKQRFYALRQDPSPEALDELLTTGSFQILCEQITDAKGEQFGMTLAYLKDISALLALVSAVRDGDIELHLQAERDMLKQVFAFDHQNYSRYLTYQHVLLTNLKLNQSQSFEDLKLRGIGANYSGDKFAAVHGDLVTEYFNRETKGTAGPFRQGYSTNIATSNKWVNTVHIHAKLRMVMRDKVNINTSSTHKELTDGAKKRHQKNVEALKDALSSYNINPFGDGPAKVITTGVEIKHEVIDGLLKANEVGNRKYLKFVQDRLVNKTVSFYTPITRLNIDTGMKKVKKTPRAISILKEDVQAFGILVQNSLSMEEAFTYPLTIVPLSLGFPEGVLRQGNKANFRNHIIQESSSAQLEVAPKNARWIYDGMALLRTVKSKNTYRDWFIQLAKIITSQTNGSNPIEIDIVNDHYIDNSIKSGTRSARGDGVVPPRVHIRSIDQKMLSGKDWEEFFHSGENKNDLLRLMCQYYKTDEGRKLFKIPLVINCGEESWRITKLSIEDLPRCNHEEADTRLILHAAMDDSPAVIVSKDTDVFLLLAYGMSKVDRLPSWFIKIDGNHYIDMKIVFDNLGREVCNVLPQFHAMTGCDTTAYKFNTGKVRIFKKIAQDSSSLSLISQLGQDVQLTEETERESLKFVQIVIYNGKTNESYVATRIRLYKNLTKKSSASLPADPDSICQEIKRVHLQSFIWRNCLNAIIPPIDFLQHGWKLQDNVVTPIWFTGSQFPPSLSKRKVKTVTHEGDASESDNVEIKKSKSKPAKKRKLFQKSRNVDIEMLENKMRDGDLWESDFSSDYDNDSSDSDFEP